MSSTSKQKADRIRKAGFTNNQTDDKNNKKAEEEKEDKEQKEEKEQKKIFTIPELSAYLEKIGVIVRYNEITRNIEMQGAVEQYKIEHIRNDLPIDVYDTLKLIYRKCNKTDVFEYIARISHKDTYNPVLEMIESGKWDGEDRLIELFRIMRISDDDSLSRTLIYKWLWQNLSMLRNGLYKRNDGTPIIFGADGVLTLQSAQGAGKTTLASKFALKDDFFGEGLHLSFNDKDTTRRAASVWIGELGEIESTFKSDINALKAFITIKRDEYRLPYGHDDETPLRHTSFIGTCNNEQYLIDETGNRRFWTVSINKKMDLEALGNFDMLQLYLQIDELYARNNIQGFRLTGDEQRQLAERNSQHEKPLKAETEIVDILYMAERDNALFEEMTVTEFKDLYPVLKNYTANQIGISLNKMGVMPEMKKKDGKAQRLALLPKPKIYTSSDF